MAFSQPLPHVIKRYIQVNHEHQGVIEQISQFVKLIVPALPQGGDQHFNRFLTDLLRDLFPAFLKESAGITARRRIAPPIADYRFQLIQHIVHD